MPGKRKIESSRGFSLVELLVVIAVIGLIAAIAIPQVTKITDRARHSTAQRNAQNIASVYTAAVAAGAAKAGNDLDPAAITNLSELVTAIFNGVNGTGTLATADFELSDLTAAEVADASIFLSYDNSIPAILYLPNQPFP